jgi:hypothetical protein
MGLGAASTVYQRSGVLFQPLMVDGEGQHLSRRIR